MQRSDQQQPDAQRRETEAAARAVEAQVKRSARALAAERAAQAFWPVPTLAMAGVAFWAFGGLGLVSPAVGLVLIGAFGATLLGALVWGIRGFRWPDRTAAVARLDDELPGRPIAALNDTLAVGLGDAGAHALWAHHMRRMAGLAARARAMRPNLSVAARDPWALRLAAVVALVAAAFFARAPEPVVLPNVSGAGGPQIAAGPSFEAWASPPAYTGRPTLYLNEDAPAVLDLPVGTQVTVRVYGVDTGHVLEESVSGNATPLSDIAEGISSAQFAVNGDGRFALVSAGTEVAAWDVTMLPDAPPQIGPEGPVERAASGAMELSYTATDDYAVNRAEAEIVLDLAQVDRRHGLVAAPTPRDPILLDLPMPFSGDTTDVTETLIEDLSKHPWVGLPVTIRLTAWDAAEQTGTATVQAILPGRRFFDPLARALLEQRRDLLWTRDNADRVDQMLRVITAAPEDVFTNTTAFLMTRMALRRLGYAREDGLDAAEQEDIAELLWNAALAVEDGNLADARERLRRAQERLSDALENGATEDEIAELMQELREAMQDYMEQLAQEALQNPDQLAEQPQGETIELTQDQLQELLDRIEELAQSGQQEQAQALLEQLQQLLENLQMQAQQGGQGQQQQGQQMMQELQDTLRQQQGLADESFQELQRQFNQNRQPGQQGQGQQGQQRPFGQLPQLGQPGQPQPGQRGQGQPQPGPNADALAQRQEALRQMLDELRGRLPGPGTPEGSEARRQLEEAERQMGEARDNLDAGELNDALDRQADAMDALREGIRGLGEELQQQAQQNQGDAGEQQGDGMARDNRDPLGRPAGSRGDIRTDENMLPGVDPMRRAQELFDEIRRRSSEQSRPEGELDYLRRLLDRF
ncbi:MAG: TIGR02302 family protein [Pseudomonadota bacterium]